MRTVDLDSAPTLDPHAAVARTAAALRAGGVVAYPTEAVYGLGCDPHDRRAVERVFALKQRSPEQGMLLIGASFEQVAPFIDRARVPAAVLAEVRESWPGPFTWIFPRAEDAPAWLVGKHAGIALRVTAHAPAAALCQAFGGALVSTSANPHDQPPARDAATVRDYFGDALDDVLEAPVGALDRPTVIRDALSGAIIRG